MQLMNIGINNATVRFNYKATTCNGSTSASGITIYGFNLRADNSVCDLALMEGTQDLSSQTSITFLGWDRNSNPTSVVCLHHPDGDFMSISKESNSISLVYLPWVYVSNWDIGSIEAGSSGSPLFDHNKRVIAATSHVNSLNYVCTSQLVSGHGRLSYFWSSISSYLDPCNTGATYINSIKTNSVLGTISGANVICEDGGSIQLSHELGDAPVTWSVTPTSLFESPTSGTGANPTIYGKNNYNSGSGQISFDVGCQTHSKDVWVGAPDASDFTVYVEELYGDPVEGSPGGPFEVCEGEQYWICLYPFFLFDDQGISDVEFDFNFDYDVLDEGDDYIEIEINSSPDEEEGEVYVTTDCGYYTLKFMEFEEGDCGRYYMVITPNPTSGETTLTIETSSAETTFDETAEWELEVYSPSQTLKEKNTNLKGKSTIIQTAGWKEGVYVVRVNYKDEILTGKLVVKTKF